MLSFSSVPFNDPDIPGLLQKHQLCHWNRQFQLHQQHILASVIPGHFEYTHESHLEPQSLGTRECWWVLHAGSCGQFPRRELLGTLTPSPNRFHSVHLLQTSIVQFSYCGPNDPGRSRMVFITRCFCTSINKPPVESLIVVGCAMEGRAGGGALGWRRAN